MSNLKEKLEGFNPKSEEELEGSEGTFAELAETFLYGGYISVSDYKEERYRIFIRTVEFYCHYEGNEKDLPKDPIVYHRNGRYVKGEVPYFPLMSFHAHASGYDITFEKPDLLLRASALLRAYEVYDVQQEKFLFYDTTDKVFKVDDKRRVNKQSTYLYNFLNGFGGNNIEWVDIPLSEQHKELKSAPRQNVYTYEYDEDKKDWIKQPTKDLREWSFTRLDEIEPTKD